MKRRRRGAYCLALAMLLTAGCSLAQPEREDGEGQGDRFVGVCMVYEEPGSGDFYDNPNLEEYGADTVDLGDLGTHAFPRQVLFADEDGQFPGLDGHSMYALETVEEWGRSSTAVGDLDAASWNTNVTDEGTETDVSGTLYIGPPEDAPADWSTNDIPGVWHAYKVYQTADGRAYLDGSGNTFHGGPMGITLKEEYSTSVNGETKKDSMSVKVEVEQVPRLERVIVRQYGEDGTLLDSTDVTLSEEPEAAVWREDAAWAVVEERDAVGTKRSVYDKPGPEDETVSHTFVLLDERGVGRTAVLNFGT